MITFDGQHGARGVVARTAVPVRTVQITGGDRRSADGSAGGRCFDGCGSNVEARNVTTSSVRRWSEALPSTRNASTPAPPASRGRCAPGADAATGPGWV